MGREVGDDRFGRTSTGSEHGRKRNDIARQRQMHRDTDMPLPSTRNSILRRFIARSTPSCTRQIKLPSPLSATLTSDCRKFSSLLDRNRISRHALSTIDLLAGETNRASKVGTGAIRSFCRIRCLRIMLMIG